MEEFGLTGTAVDRGPRLPDEPGDVAAHHGHRERRSEPVAGAPGWRVVQRQQAQRFAPSRAPALAPVRSSRRGNPLLPWAAGALLSMVVLGLTVVDQSWLDEMAGHAPAVPEPPVVVQPLDQASSSAAPLTPTAAAPEAQPAAPSPMPSRVVPISPDGRGTARTRAEADTSQFESLPAPQSPGLTPSQLDGDAPRILPISLERPQSPLSPGLQLVGAASGEAAFEHLDFHQDDAIVGAPETASAVGIRVFIHYSATQRDDGVVAARLAEFLRRRGFEVAATRPVGFEIGRGDVRYFFERDLAESQRVLEDLGWFFRGMTRRAPPRASDFTHYTPKPRPGNIEIWLPSAS